MPITLILEMLVLFAMSSMIIQMLTPAVCMLLLFSTYMQISSQNVP